MPILDPVKNIATTFRRRCGIRRCRSASGPATPPALDPLQPSPYWGDERIWETRVNNHNSMFDKDGRLWLAASVRGAENPAFCKAGSDHPSAKAFPIERADAPPRGVRSEDEEVQLRRHLLLARTTRSSATTRTTRCGRAAADRWSAGSNTKMFDATGDAAKSQGWTALVLDTNGNGKRDDYVEPDQPVDPDQGQARQSPASTP